MTNHKWKIESPLPDLEYSACPRSFPAIHVPARIYPLPFAQHEYLGDPAGLLIALAGGLQLIRIVRVHHRSISVDLNFGLWKLELDKPTAASCEPRRALEDRVAI